MATGKKGSGEKGGVWGGMMSYKWVWLLEKKTGKWKLNIVQNIVEIQAKDAKKKTL